MKKNLSFMAVFALVISLSAGAVFANPKIGQKHATMKAKGKAVNCVYCHGPVAKKPKQNYMKGQANYAAIAKIADCAGAGCHK